MRWFKWFQWRYFFSIYPVIAIIYLFRGALGMSAVAAIMLLLCIFHLATLLLCFYGKNSKRDLHFLNYFSLLWLLLPLQILSLAFLLKVCWEGGIIKNCLDVSPRAGIWDWIAMTLRFVDTDEIKIIPGILGYLVGHSWIVYSVHVAHAVFKPLVLMLQISFYWCFGSYSRILQKLDDNHFPICANMLGKAIYAGIVRKVDYQGLETLFICMAKSEDIPTLQYFIDIGKNLKDDYLRQVQREFVREMGNFRRNLRYLPDKFWKEKVEQMVEFIRQTPSELKKHLFLNVIERIVENSSSLEKLLEFYDLSKDNSILSAANAIERALQYGENPEKIDVDSLFAFFWYGHKARDRQLLDEVETRLWEKKRPWLLKLLDLAEGVAFRLNENGENDWSCRVFRMALSHHLPEIRIQACKSIQRIRNYHFIPFLVDQLEESEGNEELQREIINTLETLVPFSTNTRTVKSWVTWKKNWETRPHELQKIS